MTPLNLAQLSARSSQDKLSTSGGTTSQRGVGVEGVVAVERSKYARKLASRRMMIPKPDREVRIQAPSAAPLLLRPASAANSVVSGASGDRESRRSEVNYKACKYLYSMCDCRKVGSNKTLKKLQEFRKVV